MERQNSRQLRDDSAGVRQYRSRKASGAAILSRDSLKYSVLLYVAPIGDEVIVFPNIWIASDHKIHG